MSFELLDAWRKQLQDTGEIHLRIRIRSNAPEHRIRGVMSDGTLKIDIAEIPEHGKANIALIGFLAQEFVVPRENLELTSGPLIRNKTVRIKARSS